MKDKQRKITAVFSVGWDIVSAFCRKLQGCDEETGALLIPQFWSLHISYPWKTEDPRMEPCPDILLSCLMMFMQEL